MLRGQVDLAETYGNENENGNENGKVVKTEHFNGRGRQGNK